jgi:AmmeMemoRadiSam system protein B/AmmeMemoRadiSam system protein A
MKLRLIWLLTFFLSAYADQQSVLTAHFSGSWYPADPQELRALLAKSEKEAAQQFAFSADAHNIRALIAPHAGYLYASLVATSVYRLIKGMQYDRIILLAPSHTQAFRGVIAPSASAYQTPLGTIPIDTAAIQNLIAQSPLFTQQDALFAREHAIELELPYTQFFLLTTSITPLIVGSLSDAELVAVAAVLKKIITPRTLVVISSDFIHYGPQYDFTPFADHQLLRIKQLDSAILWAIQKTDRADFMRIITQTNATVCGATPIAILLALIEQNAFGPVTTRLVSYDTSLRVTRGSDSLVTYAGLITTTDINNTTLSAYEKRSLLDYARAILENTFTKKGEATLLQPIMTPSTAQKRGVFVTLYAPQRELRGCIGTVQPIKPIYQAVAEMARAAAFEDPRFPPVTAAELKNLSIEISILTEPRPIKSYKEIMLNKHGIILSNHGRSALFLPKVPQEFGFDLSQTLTELSKKAGLPADAWQQPDTTYQVFEAIDFAE